MGNYKKKPRLIGIHEGMGAATISVRLASPRYANEFMRLKCAPDMIDHKLFPNFKEVTESMAAYSAIRTHLKMFPLEADNVIAVCVGDGTTPRTAAMIAMRTKWQTISVDPRMNIERAWHKKIARLYAYADYIENFKEEIKESNVVIVAVHSHAKLEDAVSIVNREGVRSVGVVAIGCCVDQTLGDRQPNVVYDDWGIWSPKRTVKIWKPEAKPVSAIEDALGFGQLIALSNSEESSDNVGA